jgi:hypothetical protein
MEKFFAYLVIVFVLFLTSGTSDVQNDKNVMVGGFIFFFAYHLYTIRMIEYYFLYITAVFIAISGIYFVINGAYDGVTYMGFLIKVYLAYLCREISKEHFSTYFVKIVFVLTCVSFPLFLIQLINFDILYNINNLFGPTGGNEPISSSFIYAMIPIHAHRNSGFMWEPGAYAAILAMTLYINIFREREDVFSRKNVVFIIAILTTQSTMGFLALLIPLVFVLQKAIVENKAMRQIAVVLVPTLIALFIVLFTTVDFLAAKIFEQTASVDEEMAFVEEGNRDGFVVATTRITSVLLDMETIKNYPLLGIGIDMRTTGMSKLVSGSMTVTACGITNLLLRFGFLGLIAYIGLLYQKSIFEETAHKIGWICLLFTILASNELSASPLLHLFIF